MKRAVDTVYKEAGKKNVYTYGPIIHNSEVVNDLKKKGVEVFLSYLMCSDLMKTSVHL